MVFHDKSKHIEIKYHYIRDMVQRGDVKLCYIAIDDQTTDVLMKPLAKVNLVFHDKSKHIEIKYHYISDMVQRGAVKLQYVAIDEQIADVLTKPLASVKFEYFKEKLGVPHIEVPSKGK